MDAETHALMSLESLFGELGLRNNQPIKRQNNMGRDTVEADDDLFKAQMEGLDEKVDLLVEATKTKQVTPTEAILDNKADVAEKSLGSVKKSIDTIQKCSGSTGCSGKDIADTVFDVLGTIGFVVGLAFPAAGAVIAVVVALGSFIASFFGDKPVRALPGLDAAAVEAAAFKAVQRAEDTTTFAEFADFAYALRAANSFNANILNTINEALKAGSQSAENIDRIVDEWFDQYHDFKWEDVVTRMKDSGTSYFKAYGDITGSRRGKFADWIKDSKKTCKLEYYVQANQKGRDSLNTCKKNMATAKTNYEYAQNFGLNYIKVATLLVAYWSGVVSILSKHSTCGDNMEATFTCKYSIAFESLKHEVTESMFKHAQALKETTTALATTCEAPASNVALWPWNQKCEDWPGQCNYQYLVLMTQTDQEATVNGCEGGGCKMLITERYYQTDIEEECRKEVKNAQNAKGKAFYGGIIGWQSGLEPKDQSSCKGAATVANKAANDYSMLAIPSYTLDIPDCAALFSKPENFGIKKGDAVGYLPDTIDGNTSCPTIEETVSGKSFTKLDQHSMDVVVHFDSDVTGASTMKQGSYSIGKFTGFEGNIAKFANGDYCAPISAPRSGSAEFVEDCTAAQLSVTSVSEPTTCVYKMVITGTCPSCATSSSIPAPAPSCPEGTYSIVGYNGSDGACWEEKIKACTVDEARTKMAGHYLAAAKEMDWSSGWVSGGSNWNRGVENKPCKQRGFDDGDFQKCFYQSWLNKGCMYD